ncbi:kelch like family member 18 [Dermatophagoides pteronyssinus]|uniref:kelch like family member 18 n=1 Tax=Dermatophagoides pteronyssinus TaxID=6956 RepID=UPI003F67AA70
MSSFCSSPDDQSSTLNLNYNNNNDDKRLNIDVHSTSSSLATSPVIECLIVDDYHSQNQSSSSISDKKEQNNNNNHKNNDNDNNSNNNTDKEHLNIIKTNNNDKMNDNQLMIKPRSWTVKLHKMHSTDLDNNVINNSKSPTSKQDRMMMNKIINIGKQQRPEPVQKITETNNNKRIVSVDNFTYLSMEHANASFPIFRELWQRRQVCDVVIKIDGHRFFAHRIVLCATIPYFYAMFTNDLAERNQMEIEIKSNENDDHGPSLDSEAFESLLNYAYTGAIEINSKNVQSILIGASFLGLENVQHACSDYLKVRLNVSNVIQIKTFAFALGCDALVQASKRFIHRNFEQIADSDDFLQMDSEELIEIIGSDELNVSNEKIVFEAVIRWTLHDEEMRKQNLPELIRRVRLPLLFPEYLTDVVLGQKLVRQSLECRDLIDEAKDFHLLPSRRESIARERTRPRSGHHVQGSIYAVGGLTKTGDSMSTVEVYDPQMKRWRMAEAMSMMRSRVGVAVMERKLYAIGGYNGFDRLNTVEVYDSKVKQWKRVKSMHYRRSAVGAAALNDELYVCGGYDGSISLNVVERYSSMLNEWNEVTPMNIKRSAAGVVSLDGYIYALGGHDGLMIFNSVERYDPRTKQWEFVESMLSRRCRLGCCCFGGKIYVCGGYDGCTFLQTAEVFDPQTGKWSQISKMRATRSRVALVANCSRLFAIGGYDGVSNLSSVEAYDIEKDSWEMVASMVAHEGGVGVGVIPDNY